MDIIHEQSESDECNYQVGHSINDFDLENVIGFDALWNSMQKCRRGVIWKDSVANYCINGAESTIKLCEELHNQTYQPQKTTTFKITSPKERTITATSFRDRVYQRSLNDNILYPAVTRSLIYDNAACQINKGTDFARKRLKCHLQRHFRKHGMTGGIFKGDIEHYYDSLPHEQGENVFKTAPNWAYQRAVEILQNQYEGDQGYKPGSQMVQIVGIAALSPIDHFIKEKLHIKGYIRYMDDFILIHEDKEYLKYCWLAIEQELSKIGLKLHPKKTRILDINQQIDFLGFNFRLTNSGKIIMTLKSENIKRMRRRITRLARLENKNLRPSGTTKNAYEGWRAHATKGNSYKLLQRYDKWFKELSVQYLLN